PKTNGHPTPPCNPCAECRSWLPVCRPGGLAIPFSITCCSPCDGTPVRRNTCKMCPLDVGGLGESESRHEPDQSPHSRQHTNSSRRGAIDGHAPCTVSHRLKPDIP